MKKSFIPGLLIAIAILSAMPFKRAGALNLASQSDIFTFAESLFSQQDYYRAITEYKRLLFFFPQSDFTKQAKFNIAKAYQLGGKYELSIKHFLDIKSEYKDADIGKKAHFESVESLYRMGSYESALLSYHMFLERPEYTDFLDLAVYRIGLSQLHLRRPEDARTSFGSIEEPSDLYPLSQDMIGKTGDFEKLKRKSPLLAGILSIFIPGAGQFYNGRIKDGIIALITNGLFIWGTYEAYRREYYSIGIVTSVFALGWYSGNIYGAVNGSYKYNRNKEDRFFESLKPKYELISR